MQRIAKLRMHEVAVKVKQICENLKRRATDEHFDLLITQQQNKWKINSEKGRIILSKKWKNSKIIQGKRVSRNGIIYKTSSHQFNRYRMKRRTKVPAKFRTKFCSRY